MQLPTLLDMLKAGVHFGHLTSKRHPKMARFIFGMRSNVHIIDLEATQAYLEKALAFVTNLVKEGGSILFVATKKQAQEIVRTAAESCGMPYMVDRWIGGLLTNFSEISRVIKRYQALVADIEAGKFNAVSKREKLRVERERAKLEAMVRGIKNMKQLPQALFVVDIKKEKTAVAEARRKGLPIVAIADTNVNPDLVTYPIPGNDDATRSIALIANLVAEAVSEGKKSRESAEAGTTAP